MRRNKAQVVQPHIPGLARADKKPTVQRKSEAVIQAHAIAVLAGLGYGAMEVGKTRARVTLEGECRCPRCKHEFTASVSGFPTGWQGNTPGYPDVSFFRWVPGWPAVFIPVEMKGEGTPIRKEQQDLVNAGRTVFAYSEGEAVRAVLAAEIAMDRYRFPDERRDRIERFLAENEGKI